MVIRSLFNHSESLCCIATSKSDLFVVTVGPPEAETRKGWRAYSESGISNYPRWSGFKYTSEVRMECEIDGRTGAVMRMPPQSI